MNVTVNGEQREFDAATLTVVELLDALGLTGRRLAVELNQRIVPRATHADQAVGDGDVVEIVQFVGGG